MNTQIGSSIFPLTLHLIRKFVYKMKDPEASYRVSSYQQTVSSVIERSASDTPSTNSSTKQSKRRRSHHRNLHYIERSVREIEIKNQVSKINSPTPIPPPLRGRVRVGESSLTRVAHQPPRPDSGQACWWAYNWSRARLVTYPMDSDRRGFPPRPIAIIARSASHPFSTGSRDDAIPKITMRDCSQ